MLLVFQKWMLLFMLPLVSINGLPVDANKPPAPHPFYVSVTEITQNATDKTMEVSCKFFAEDIEQALEKTYKSQLDITAAKDKPAFDKLVPDYVNKHLSIVIDGRVTPITYVGFEKEKESVYAYFEISGVTSAKAISITNSLLHEFINEQINIMHLTVGGKRQSTKLNYPDTKAAFAF